MDEPPDAMHSTGLDHVLGPKDVGLVKRTKGPPRSRLGGDVKHELATLHRARDGGSIGEVALDLLDAFGAQLRVFPA
jgi:hypothetical protein